MPPRIPAGTADLKISLPLPLLRAFKAAIHDPIRNRARYASAGTIIAGLLRKWLLDNGHPLTVTPEDTDNQEET